MSQQQQNSYQVLKQISKAKEIPKNPPALKIQNCHAMQSKQALHLMHKRKTKGDKAFFGVRLKRKVRKRKADRVEVWGCGIQACARVHVCACVACVCMCDYTCVHAFVRACTCMWCRCTCVHACACICACVQACLHVGFILSSLECWSLSSIMT